MNLENRIKLLEEEINTIEYEANGGVSHLLINQEIKSKRKTELFFGDNPQVVYEMLQSYKTALGNSSVGNSRLGGMSKVYKDLIVCFYKFKIQGITLPRWSISKKHSQLGLFEILKSHGYIPDEISHEKFNEDTLLRKAIHHKVERVLVRVANSVEVKPPQK